MATVTKVTMIDDLDGSSDAKTIAFGLEGVDYEIDLSDANADELRKALARYIESARKSAGRRGRRPSTGRGTGGSGYSREQLAAVRAWARNNGYKVSDRGRLPATVLRAFEASN